MNALLKFGVVLVLLLVGNACCSGSSVANGPKVTDKVFFDLTIGGEKLGRVEIGLFGKTGRCTTPGVVGSIAVADSR